jgi:hypothetical protein
VSCEEEERAAEAARRDFEIQRQICDQLAIEKMNSNDPDVRLCRVEQQQRQMWSQEKAEELRACRAAAEAVHTLQAEGLVTFLRVHEPGMRT